ncbi:restriction endonuclease subunit S [Thiocystis violascens]|uniref:Restriction endonuclease S subunit n=1 Tax=Thiocystis violascens (strain ATCC 17096 / DSM 198 / 6111) TaxID=765911 RepID=I3YGZ0_THIV6|nr:restriction endonuclease subunit S [Thiocystis violascens]AFL76258.1 hypothetical protein Thivi_4461 [Thiocystis violascens DSM 198]
MQRSELNNELRIDAQYFQKRYLFEDACRRHFKSAPLGSLAFITDGPHGYHEVDPASNIAMLTAKCAKNWFAARDEADTISLNTHSSNQRSSLETGDLILSTRGTVGACAFVTARTLPANIDQDVARIAINQSAGFCAKYVLAYLNSSFGQDWILRNSTGMVQQGLSLAKVRDLPIPLLRNELRENVAQVIDMAYMVLEDSRQSLADADSSLLVALGLSTWKPPEALTYVRSSRDAFEAGRMDAEYFAPRVANLLALLGRDGLALNDVAPARHERFTPTGTDRCHYIEIGGLETDGTAQAEAMFQQEAPTRATQHVRSDDVITSTVRPIRRLSAVIAPEQDGYVCSSGFVVLRPHLIRSEVLLTYLRLPLVCELMDLHTSATMYPAISESDLLALPIPNIQASTQETITKAVQSARQAKQRATQLLEAAKRAVEIAIETDEDTALAYLNQASERP